MKFKFFTHQFFTFSEEILLNESIMCLAASISFAYVHDGIGKTSVSLIYECKPKVHIDDISQLPNFDKLLFEYYQYINTLVDNLYMVNVTVFISSTEFSARFMNHPLLISKDNLRYLKDIENTNCCIQVVRKLEQADFTITKE
jgi:hypothetical protein